MSDIIDLLKSKGAQLQSDGSWKGNSDYAFTASLAGSTLTITTDRGVYRYCVEYPYSADPCVDPTIPPQSLDSLDFEISHALDPEMAKCYDGLNPHFYSNPVYPNLNAAT